MSTPAPSGRRERRELAREAAPHRPDKGRASTAERRQRRVRSTAFAAFVVAVLGFGGYLAFGDFIGERGTSEGGMISVQASMAGFTPNEIRVAPGQTVNLDFWTQDSPGHLQGGVHTLFSEALGLRAELPGAAAVSASRIAVTFEAPMTPGEYDIYCDTCCGGRESPTMHGKIIVEDA